MTAELISGTQIRKEILAELSEEVRQMKAKHGRGPGWSLSWSARIRPRSAT